MTDVVMWILVVEAIGVAFLPLIVWLTPALPDRGYIFAKVLGLLLITYLVWLLGSALPVVATAAPAYVVLLVVGIASWWRGGAATIRVLRGIVRLAVIEECLFVGALVVYALLRVHVFGSDITHTEQFMDMALTHASGKSASYPPYDPWMSGHTINYYYFGYLMIANLIKMSGVAPAIGYNLGLAFVFAATVAGAYSIGYTLVRKYLWAALAPIFVALIGNWHALLWQAPHSGCANATTPGQSDFWNWLWPSTRVVGNDFTLGAWACNASSHGATNTINEYPLFSFVLGDLHPHVLSLPAVLLVLALGANLVFSEHPFDFRRDQRSSLFFVVLAIATGALFTINSWDYPTYALLIAACIAVGAFIGDTSTRWWRTAAASIVAFGLASLILFAPFYVHFRTLSYGFGLVTTPTDPFEFVQVFGFAILTCGLLVGTLSTFLTPAETNESESSDALPLDRVGEAGVTNRMFAVGMAAIVVVALVLIVMGWKPGAVAILLTTALIWMCSILWRVVNTDEPNRADAVALVLLGVGVIVLLLTETIYVKDVFQGGGSYRMNTVFKFYYQAWVLLGLAAAYGSSRVWVILRTYFSRHLARAALAAITVGLVGAGIYTGFVPSATVQATVPTLDGSAWVAASHPNDYAGIEWLRSHVSGTPVILEATKADYEYFSRVSTFTGLPTVMGWSGHEDQWRLNDPQIGARINDVRAMYTSPSERITRALLRKYSVRYVFVGDAERYAYGRMGAAERKFSGFMRPVFRQGGTVIYTWYPSLNGKINGRSDS